MRDLGLVVSMPLAVRMTPTRSSSPPPETSRTVAWS